MILKFYPGNSFVEGKPSILVHSSKGTIKGQDQWYVHTLPWLSTHKKNYNIIWIYQGSEKYVGQMYKLVPGLFDGVLRINTSSAKAVATSWPEMIRLTYQMLLDERKTEKVLRPILLFEVYSLYTAYTDNFAERQLLDDIAEGKIGPKGGDRGRAFWNRLSEWNALRKFFTITQVSDAWKIPVLHCLYDNQEQQWNLLGKQIRNPKVKYSVVFGYKSEMFRHGRFDNVLWDLQKNQTESYKELAFTLGYSITTDARLYFREELNPYLDELSKNFDTAFFLQDNRDTNNIINTRVLRKEYYDTLAKSRYTMVLPAYEARGFSYMRFLEAIANGCIPLIWDKCDPIGVNEFFTDYQYPKEKYEELMTQPENISQKIKELDWPKVMQDLKQHFMVNAKPDISLERWIK